VIAGNGEDGLLANIFTPGDGDKTSGELFEAAEGPLRFGLTVEARLNGGDLGLVDRLDTVEDGLQGMGVHLSLP
jgi:hypothetical protein